MDLLPEVSFSVELRVDGPAKCASLSKKRNSAYGTQEYWDERYAKEAPDATFDWLKKYEDLKSYIHQFVPDSSKRVLHLGCGNSTLPIDMYDDGYEQQVNLDYSPVVIEKQQALHGEIRPKMTCRYLSLTLSSICSRSQPSQGARETFGSCRLTTGRSTCALTRVSSCIRYRQFLTSFFVAAIEVHAECEADRSTFPHCFLPLQTYSRRYPNSTNSHKGTMDAMMTQGGDPWVRGRPTAFCRALTFGVAESSGRDHAGVQGRSRRGVQGASSRWYLSVSVSNRSLVVEGMQQAHPSFALRRTWGQPHFRKRHLVREGWTIQVEELGGESSFSYFLYILSRTNE